MFRLKRRRYKHTSGGQAAMQVGGPGTYFIGFVMRHIRFSNAAIINICDQILKSHSLESFKPKTLP